MPLLSVIIPSRNDEPELTLLVENLKSLEPNLEIIIETGKNRAAQMNLGAKKAKGDFLWFLHADSRVTKESIESLRNSLNKSPDSLLYFNLRFYDASPLMKINEIGAHFRSRFFKMPFGDQGLCLSKSNFERLGGFDEQAPYGEDHLLVWKARRFGIQVKSVGSSLFTSSRKYEKNGWLQTTAKHLWFTYQQALPESIKLLTQKQGSPALAIFVKTPELSPVKTRLAASIGKKPALDIYFEMLQLTEKVVDRAQKELGVTPYWAIAEKGGLGSPHWKRYSKLWQGDGELGDRLSKIYSELLSHHSSVFLIGADCPDLDLPTLESAVLSLKDSPAVIGRTSDGGFYLFGGSCPIPTEVWNQVPYSSGNTASTLVDLLAKRVPVKELKTLNDVDTIEDLKRCEWKSNVVRL